MSTGEIFRVSLYRVSSTPSRYVRAIFNINVESNLGLFCFRFTSLCDWSRKLVSLSQHISLKSKANHDLIVRFFPRFRLFGAFCFEF